MRIDEYYYKQPEPRFIEWLNSPIHEKAPENFKRKIPRADEVVITRAYIADCPLEWRDIIFTATEDFEKFLRVCGAYGRSYPIKISYALGYGEGDFKISVSSNECVIYASEPEGARRAIYYVEEEMIKREGTFLQIGDTLHRSHIKRRITRGFFSPTNRAPKWGDELLDGIDYYPENYLSRLAHNGTNGLWIYTSFGQLVNSPYIPAKDGNYDRRMEKLGGVVEKCKRYGIKVYIFAIEPIGIPRHLSHLYEDMLGANLKDADTISLCPRRDKTRAHVIYCLEHVFKSIPDLAGFITIPAGERLTTCVSIGDYTRCPRCGKYSRGENLAYSVDMIKEGLRRAGTGAEFISWTYGHRYWDNKDIEEYVEKSPADVTLMQNFEDRGVDRQLGKERIAWDYWLSYPGPSDMFSATAKAAQKHKVPMYAKMQVCSSHEIATVPYIPVPGILFDKYKAARDLCVTGIMECWYFGNYPSLMNRASTLLSYLDDFSDKHAFLVDLASRIYGETMADSVARAWTAFEEGYRNYPTNIMFSYYGPMHDGVVWELSPIPKNRALPRSWQLIDPPCGDRIGECLFKGHTLDEVTVLSENMCQGWQRGMEALPLPKSDEHTRCAEAINVLFKSGKNILNFYKLRGLLGSENGDPCEIIAEMECIVRAEIENSREMIKICESDPRVGYHSEAEGFKFFHEKLQARITKLEALFDTDFPTIKKRVAEGKKPLAFYYAEDDDYYPLGTGRDSFEWEALDADRAFGAYLDGGELVLPIRCNQNDEFSVCLEFELCQPESTVNYTPKNANCAFASREGELSLGAFVLSHQSVWGEGIGAELSNYRLETKSLNGMAEHYLSVKIPTDKWNGKTAIRLNIIVGGVAWKRDSDPVRTLGKADVSPGDFGFLLPV